MAKTTKTGASNGTRSQTQNKKTQSKQPANAKKTTTAKKPAKKPAATVAKNSYSSSSNSRSVRGAGQTRAKSAR